MELFMFLLGFAACFGAEWAFFAIYKHYKGHPPITFTW